MDILFLHATGFNGETYRPLLQRLPDGLAWEAWDMRGHGRNPLPADPSRLTSWMIFADDVIAALDQRGVRQLVLAGHSLGSVVSLLIAAKRPDLVRSLLMIEPPLVPPRIHFYARLPGGICLLKKYIPIAKNAGRRAAVFPDMATIRKAYTGRGAFRTWQPAFLEAYLRGGTRESPAGIELCCSPAWEQSCFVAFQHDTWGAFKGVASLPHVLPVHILVGEKNSTAKAQLRRIRRLAPTAVIEQVPGTTHFIPMEVPDLVASRITALAA